jgi:eukaryotic-like serine/threonine-protein kinase
MGEVYRARDTKLKRHVALKVLPDAFIADHDRLARFQQEAEILASLEHPHIARIYGVVEADGMQALVLEFVDGTTLADRIADGPLPMDEALQIAQEIADALEAAHEHGVIHRDLKPGNIKLLPDGSVKVLDFGLAKVLDAPSDGRDLSESPTITSPALTRMGVILGTAAYMSPEQARGKKVGKRSDVWAFGCVLYEMLAGCRAFDGNDVSETLAFVITKEPDWSALPLDAPRPALALLRWCLQKQVRHRLRDIGDARLAIDDALTELGGDTSVGSRPEGRRSEARRPLFWVTYAVVALSAVSLTLVAMPRRADVPLVSPKRLVLQLPAGDQLAFGEAAPVGEGRPALAISPDGSRIVYVARHAGIVRLYQRPLDQFDSAPIPGTEGAFNPFFSPDGEWVGFFTPTHLKKVALSGGDPVTLSEARNPYGAAWSRDSVFFAQAFGMILSRVPAAGGVTQVVRSGAPKFWPFAVPGDDALLLSGWPTGIHVVRFNDREPAERLIAGTYTNPQLTPTGHLIAVRPGQLLAAAFDQARWAITGPEALVLNGLRTDSWGGAHFSFSRDGTLAYVRGAPATTGTLVALDRAGGETPLRGFGADNYGAFKLSPSGEKLAITVSGATNELWVHDLARGNRTRLNASASSSHPLWTPDGDWVSFGSSAGGPWNIFRQRADGSGELDQLVSSENDQIPYSWSPDGRVLAYTEVNPTTRSDIWLLSEADRQVKPILRSAFNEGQPAISPDGKWLAYVSDESGKSEVYVTSYPAIHGRNPISVDGGEEPIWSRNSNELYYRNGQRWMAVTTSTRQGFEASRPRVLFEGNYLNVSGLSYDVTADGQRFMLIRGLDAPAVREIHVVLNWFEDLKRLAPIK